MLKSKSFKPLTYVGYTNDLKRIKLHNSGKGQNLPGKKMDTYLQRKI